MNIFRKNLLKEQKSFVKRVRNLTTLMALAVLVMLVLMVHLASTSKPVAGPALLQPEDVSAGPSALVPTASPDDPCQLIPPEVLSSEKHGVPVRVDLKGARATVIDKAVLMQVLERLKQVSEEELAARVDKSITWETFDDRTLRDRAKGRVCRFRGTMRRLEEKPGVNLSEIAIEHLYEVQLQDNAGRWYTVYCFEQPATQPLRTDAVRVTGVFYKLIQYSTKKIDKKTQEKEVLVTPLIIARTVETLAELRLQKGVMERLGDSMPQWALALLLIGGCLMVCFLMAKLMRGKPSRAPVVRRR